MLNIVLVLIILNHCTLLTLVFPAKTAAYIGVYQ
jgi:hypothetical protein